MYNIFFFFVSIDFIPLLTKQQQILQTRHVKNFLRLSVESSETLKPWNVIVYLLSFRPEECIRITSVFSWLGPVDLRPSWRFRRKCNFKIKWSINLEYFESNSTLQITWPLKTNCRKYCLLACNYWVHSIRLYAVFIVSLLLSFFNFRVATTL